MRLSELCPKWITLNNWVSPDPFYIGLSFNCPCERCRQPACLTCGHCVGAKRLAVNFWPPVDPKGLLGTLFQLPTPTPVHLRSAGLDFETLTLSPSVGFDSIGHWHGHITDGNVVG